MHLKEKIFSPLTYTTSTELIVSIQFVGTPVLFKCFIQYVQYSTVCTVQYVLYSMYCTVCTVQYYQGIKEKFAQKTDSFDCTYYNLNTVQIFQHKLFIYNYVEFFLTLKMSKRSSKRWIRLSLHYFG